ncbi:MAG: hypothetical protein JKY37_00285 [Nannocystaceae bacterium]|nr:hypothetical protein [Nannocystaceae bacterium]
MTRFFSTASPVAFGVLAFGVLASTGCDQETADTCSVSNDALSLVAIVVDNGVKLRAEIDFESGDRTGLPNPLQVCDSETLTIGGESPTVTEKGDRIVYSVTLPLDTPPEVAFVLERNGEDEVEVRVSRPPSFSVTAPDDGQTVPRSEDLTLMWSPTVEGSEMLVSVEEDVGYGLCVVTQEGEHHYKTRVGVPVPDSGQWTIPAGAVTSETPGPCAAFYNLRRVLRSPYPADLAEGGFVEARVLRTVEIESVP